MGQNQSGPGGAGPPGDGKDKVRGSPSSAEGVAWSACVVLFTTAADRGSRHDLNRPHALSLLCPQEKKKKYEPPAPPPRVGKKQKKRESQGLGSKLPAIAPNARCKLRLLKLERVKDYLLMEEEWVKKQEQMKPHEERNEEDRSKVGAPCACAHIHAALTVYGQAEGRAHAHDQWPPPRHISTCMGSE
jgi:hypothetical protein